MLYRALSTVQLFVSIVFAITLLRFSPPSDVLSIVDLVVIGEAPHFHQNCFV